VLAILPLCALVFWKGSVRIYSHRMDTTKHLGKAAWLLPLPDKIGKIKVQVGGDG
jgi:hypothetical protein